MKIDCSRLTWHKRTHISISWAPIGAKKHIKLFSPPFLPEYPAMRVAGPESPAALILSSLISVLLSNVSQLRGLHGMHTYIRISNHDTRHNKNCFWASFRWCIAKIKTKYFQQSLSQTEHFACLELLLVTNCSNNIGSFIIRWFHFTWM